MEVASPLAFANPNKRSLACSSPTLPHTNASGVGSVGTVLDNSTCGSVDERVTKRRRRFLDADTAMDSLSKDFSSQSIFFKNMPSHSIFAGSQGSSPSMKRLRTEGPSCTAQDELNRVVREQASLIESLKADKTTLNQSLTTLQTDHDRTVKENQILRKAVTIQQERHVQAAKEVKSIKAQAEDRVKGLEQMILQLRYHLQAQQAPMGNDFMQQRPPDVF